MRLGWLVGVCSALASAASLPASELSSGDVQGNAVVYFGLENPSEAQWRGWRDALERDRARVLAETGFDSKIYRDPLTSWSDRSFRQFFLFMLDESFYDRNHAKYRTRELIRDWRARFGRVDSVLLWHAYPRLGFDSRTQFDFYRQMPGGLAKLRREVSNELHANGIRVFIDYNPWDAGTYEELAEIVAALNADGVMLDTMSEVPAALKAAVDARRPGVVFSPERQPSDRDLQFVRQSWAQWYDIGGMDRPSIYRHQWLVPQHRQFAIRRWDRSRKFDIVYSFFNGSGLLIWENVFGSWNPYSPEEQKLLAETGAILTDYEDFFAQGAWSPLVPTGVVGLDANRWDLRIGDQTRSIYILRNRSDRTLKFREPFPAPAGLQWISFWGGDFEVAAGGTQAVALDSSEHAAQALAHFRTASKQAGQAEAVEFKGPRLLSEKSASSEPRNLSASMIELPGGSFSMLIEHERRECGCYPFGVDPRQEPLWGWFYKDKLTHRLTERVQPFAIKRTAVTNAEFLQFVRESGYRPVDVQNFLKQIPRDARGNLPPAVNGTLGALPVTYVSLDDARAYASWKKERLPSEVEWQWAAESGGRGFSFPWGTGTREFEGKLRAADADRELATKQGVVGLAGNAWEWTEGEWSDGHTRFTLLRGGTYLRAGRSEWLVERGTRPNQSHVKYILMGDGLDRSESISFRTVADLKK